MTSALKMSGAVRSRPREFHGPEDAVSAVEALRPHRHEKGAGEQHGGEGRATLGRPVTECLDEGLRAGAALDLDDPDTSGETTSTPTSATPWSSTSSKLAHAFHTYWSGNRDRSQSRAARSHENADGVTCTHLGESAFMALGHASPPHLPMRVAVVVQASNRKPVGMLHQRRRRAAVLRPVPIGGTRRRTRSAVASRVGSSRAAIVVDPRASRSKLTLWAVRANGNLGSPDHLTDVGSRSAVLVADLDLLG